MVATGDSLIDLGETNPNWTGITIRVKRWLTFAEQTRAEEAGRTVERIADAVTIRTNRVEITIGWVEVAVLEWNLRDATGAAITPDRQGIENAKGVSPLLTAASSAITGFYEEADAKVFLESGSSD